MLKTIDRYVIREVFPPFILSLLIFTFVLELPPVMQQLEQLLAKGVPWPTVGRIILLLSPQALGLTSMPHARLNALADRTRSGGSRPRLLQDLKSPSSQPRPRYFSAPVASPVNLWSIPSAKQPGA